MSELITHVQIADDDRALVTASPVFAADWKAAVVSHPDLTRLGSDTMLGDCCNPTLLKELKHRRDAGGWGEREAEVLAWVQGWLSHRAADRQMKPVYRRYDPDCPRKPTDCSVYHDVAMMRLRMSVPEAQRPPELPGLDVDRAEEVMASILQRAFVTLHTIRPDETDPWTWMEGALTLYRKRVVDLRRYAKAYASPDPDLWQTFIVDANFYDESDPLLTALANGGDLAPFATREALTALPDKSRCLYVRGLLIGMSYIVAAQDYLDGKLDDAALIQALDIGKPEIDFDRI